MACDHAFLGGSSTWARTRDLRINRTNYLIVTVMHDIDCSYHLDF